jgi:hypothetical protein
MDERLEKLGSKVRRIGVEPAIGGLAVHLYFLDRNRRLQHCSGVGESFQKALSAALDKFPAQEP